MPQNLGRAQSARTAGAVLPRLSAGSMRIELIWLSVSAVAWLQAYLPGAPGPALIPLFVGFAAVFVLPGRLLKHALGLGAGTILTELAEAAGLSVIVLAVTCVVAMEAGWSPDSLVPVLLTCGSLGAGLGVYRAWRSVPAETGPAANPLGLLGVAGMLLLIPVTYMIGGTVQPAPSAEETLHLTLVRQLWSMERLDVLGYFYLPETPATYIYAPYHLGLAVLAKAAQLDPLVVFLKIRACFTVIAICALYGVLRQLRSAPLFAELGLMVLVVLTWTNVAGQVYVIRSGTPLPLYWAQLTPLAHLGDYGLGVLLPLLLFFLARMLRRGTTISPETLVFVLLAWATLIIHARETVQILLYLGLMGIAWLVSGVRDRQRLVQLAAVAAAIAGAGLLLMGVHGQFVEHVVAFEQYNKTRQVDALATLARGPGFGLFSTTTYYVDSLLFRHVHALAIILAPLTILFWPRFWAVFLGAGIVGFYLIFRIPWLAYGFTAATYSEIFMTPLRYVNLATYLLICVVSYWLFTGAWKLGDFRRGDVRPSRRRVATCLGLAGLSVAIWGVLPRAAAYWAMHAGNSFFVAFLGLLAVAAAWRWRGGAPAAPARTEIVPEAGPSWRVLAPCLAAISGILLIQSPPSLPAQLIGAEPTPDPRLEKEWYEASRYQQQIPYEIIRALRELAEPDSVVLYDYDAGLLGPMFADVNVTHSGLNLSTDIWGFVDTVREVRGDTTAWPEAFLDAYAARSAYAYEATKSFPPLFWDGYSDAQQLEFLARLKVAYLAFSATRHPHIAELIRRHPERFRHRLTVDQNGPYHLYEVR